MDREVQSSVLSKWVSSEIIDCRDELLVTFVKLKNQFWAILQRRFEKPLGNKSCKPGTDWNRR